jgi:hypothetical protein
LITFFVLLSLVDVVVTIFMKTVEIVFIVWFFNTCCFEIFRYFNKKHALLFVDISRQWLWIQRLCDVQQQIGLQLVQSIQCMYYQRAKVLQ